MSELSISKITGAAVNKVNDFADNTKTYFVNQQKKKFNLSELLSKGLVSPASASAATTATQMNNLGNI